MLGLLESNYLPLKFILKKKKMKWISDSISS